MPEWSEDDLRPCRSVQPVIWTENKETGELVFGQAVERDCENYDETDPTPQRDDILKGMFRLGFTANDLFNKRVSKNKLVYVAIFGKIIYKTGEPCSPVAKVVSVASLIRVLIGASGYYETARAGKMVERYFCGPGTIEERMQALFNLQTKPEHITGIVLRKV